MGTGSDTAAQEIRLALVLNGGASLAVWMGGVIHEIDLLRRATSGTPLDAVREYDRPVFERWRSLGARADGTVERKVVVDIIAGASAGGLNGTLLATAIARGAALDPVTGDGAGPRLRQVWTQTASLTLGALLPPLDAPRRPSLLDGDYFTTAVHKALQDIDGDPEQARPVTLYVTATSMNPSAKTYLDSFGQPLTSTDHRRLYRFRTTSGALTYHPPGQATPVGEQMFTPADVDYFDGEQNTTALTTATRASASYPVAFAPVLEAPYLVEPDIRVLGEDGGSWLIDGGVLDNAPFDPVLKTITESPLSGRVRRLLVYIVPSSGVAVPDAGEGPAMPPWYRVALAALSDPREVDLRSHLERLQELLREANGRLADTGTLLASLLADQRARDDADAAARTLLPTYRRASALGGIAQARLILATNSPAPVPLVTEEDLDGTDPLWAPAAGQQLVADPWRWGVGVAERTVLLLVRDLRRRLDATAEADSGGAQVLRDALTALSGTWLPRVAAVQREFAAALSQLGTSTDAADRVPTETVPTATIVAEINDVITVQRINDVLAWLIEQAAAAYRAAAEPELTAETVLRCALSVEVLSRTFDVRSPGRPFAPFEFLRLGPDTAMPVLAGRAEGEIANALGDGKLYGRQAGDFAAFGAASWRRWDWLMGRLDAVAHLGTALAAPQGWVERTQAAVLTSEGVSIDDLAAGIAAMPDTTTASLFDQLGHNSQGRAQRRDLADSTVDLLGRVRRPAAVRWLTHPLALALGRQSVPAAGWADAALRWLTEPMRRRIWRIIGPPEEVTVASAPVPRVFLLVPLLSVLLLVAAIAAVTSSGGTIVAVLGGIAFVLSGIGFLLTLSAVALRWWLAGRVAPGLPHAPTPATAPSPKPDAPASASPAADSVEPGSATSSF